eukprot:TRINITY_DN105827_c0_g1_i1.p1 TRINITY_DN105827_c0_g1~~TRINITY_DN105827_c0_g1_i1.p1  ORF type:complete len:482 (+),score=83.98 TRINITY_DN105827_c0_g1_i1:136-1581(+)
MWATHLRLALLCLVWTLVSTSSYVHDAPLQSCAAADMTSEGSGAIMMQVGSSKQTGHHAENPGQRQLLDNLSASYLAQIGQAFGAGSMFQTAAIEEPGADSSAILLASLVVVLVFTMSLFACFALPAEEEKQQAGIARQPAMQAVSNIRPMLPKAQGQSLAYSQASPKSPTRPPLLPIKSESSQRPSVEAGLPSARNLGGDSPVSRKGSPRLAPSRVSQLYARTYPAARKEEEDPGTPPQPSSPSVPTAKQQLKSRTLCPGLVVPLGSECVLAVRLDPRATGRKSTSEVAVDILDLSGKPVLRAKVNPAVKALPSLGGDARASSWSAGAVSAAREKGQQPSVVLTTIQPAPGPSLLESSVPGRTGYSDSSALALCYMTNKDGSLGMDICRANGGLYGRLGRDPSRPRYVLRGGEASEVRLFFDGIFEDHAVLITDGQQEPVADAEPSSMNFDPAEKFYKLRVSSDIDVGLVLCCLLSIDVL